jgi:hypothetical protein
MKTFYVYTRSHLKDADALCGQNAALFTIKMGDTFSNHRAFLDACYVAHRDNVKWKFHDCIIAASGRYSCEVKLGSGTCFVSCKVSHTQKQS